MRVLLIAGGWSSEREVSLSGAESIGAALRGRGHEVTWFDLRDGFDALLETAASHDFAFLNLHGAPGEDGLVQALLDRVGCPYQGSGPAGSFLALNKAASKQIFRRAGLRTPDWEFLPVPPAPEWRPRLPYPLFAKSNTGGSSLHLSKAADHTELDAILAEGDTFTAGAANIDTKADHNAASLIDVHPVVTQIGGEGFLEDFLVMTFTNSGMVLKATLCKFD